MVCCSSGAALLLLMPLDPQVAALDVLLASRPVGGGRHSELSVPGIACEACAEAIEAALLGLGRVDRCAVDVATRRVGVDWHGEAPPLIAALLAAGYDAQLVDPRATATARPRPDSHCLGSVWRNLLNARAWGV
ncbi:MAG: cation transporter [Tardiphaga sp.]